MYIRRLLIVSLVSSPLNAISASFDCTKASTNVENAVCNDTRLNKLDEELSYHYKNLRQSIDKGASTQLRLEQRQWLRMRNNMCENTDNRVACLENKYDVRIEQLKSARYPPSHPTKTELKAMCSELTNSTNMLDNGGIRQHETYNEPASYDINNDGTDEIEAPCSGGSLRIPCLNYKLADGTPLKSKSIGFEWSTYSTFGLKPFKYNGKWFQYHTYNEFLSDPAYVTYMTPKNNQYVVCEFENIDVYTFIPNPNIKSAKEVCNEVKSETQQKIERPMLEGTPTLTRSDIYDMGRRYTGILGQGYVDYNNDGVENHIAELEYTNGPDKRCIYNYFDELSQDGRVFLNNKNRDILLRMQNIDFSAYNQSAECLQRREHFNYFFEYKNKTYFEHKKDGNREVLKFENGEVQQVCDVKKRHEVVVKIIEIPEN